MKQSDFTCLVITDANVFDIWRYIESFDFTKGATGRPYMLRWFFFFKLFKYMHI